MAQALKFIVLFTILLAAIFSGSVQPCHHRDFGNGATVCVCSEKLSCDNDLTHVKVPKTPGLVTSFVTSKKGDRFAPVDYHWSKQAAAGATYSIQINQNDKFQKMIGFGGSFTDSAGINIAKLSHKLQERLIRDYFAPDGLEYNVNRLPIGSTDFSTHRYTYDDHPDPADPESLKTFALQPEDFKYKIPYIKMAERVSAGKVRVFGSPWAPPAWMKTNNDLQHGGFLKGEPGGKYYKLFAKYMVRFLEEYKKNNVSVWGITVENEPQEGLDPKFVNVCLGMHDTQQRDYIKMDLGPALVQAGFGDVKVMILDDVITNVMANVSVILNDHEAAKYVSGIAFHWYANFQNRPKLDTVREKFPDKFILSTEACEFVNETPQGSWYGNWKSFDHIVDDIFQTIQHSTSGWVDWNMALSLVGGPSWVGWVKLNSAIIVNDTAQEYYKQPFFYGIGHFSKFVVPDSVRVRSDVKTTGHKGVLTLAFLRPDHSTVVNILNTETAPVKIEIHDPVKGYIDLELKPSSLQSFIYY